MVSGPILVTARDDDDSLRNVRTILGHAPSGLLTRIELDPLSPRGVAELSARFGRDPRDLHALTGGNPFLLTELLASGGTGPPATVEDALVARRDVLSLAAQRVCNLVAVTPGGLELSLVGPSSASEQAVSSGILTIDSNRVRYRHDLARLAIESSLPQAVRANLHRTILKSLAIDPGVDIARLVHHALGAGDTRAVARYAPDAGRAAAAARAHRQAAAHFRAARDHDEHLSLRDRAALLEEFAFEAYLCNRSGDALEARREAVEAWEHLGDMKRAAANLRWLSRVAWWAGLAEEAERSATRSVELLEDEPGRELAMAYSNLSQLHMLASRHDLAIEYGRLALELAHALNDVEAEVHALTNVGTSRFQRGEEEGESQLREAFRKAGDAGLDDHAARTLVNLAYTKLESYRMEDAGKALEEALDFAEDRELWGYALYLRGNRSRWSLLRGDWTTAADDARRMLDLGDQGGSARSRHWSRSGCWTSEQVGRVSSWKKPGP